MKRVAWLLGGLAALAVGVIGACSAGGNTGSGNGENAGGDASGVGTLAGPGSGGLDNTSSGSGGDSCAAVGSQADEGLLPADVILVIDNSGSMTDEAGEVQNSMNAFVQTITAANIDVHVILISADGNHDQGICVPAPLGSGSCPNDDNQAGGFLHVFDEVGSTNGLQKVLDHYGDYSAFLRPNGTRTIGIITDDQSSLNAATFTSSLIGLDPTFQDFTFHGIIIDSSPPSHAECVACGLALGCGNCDDCCGPDPYLGFACTSFAENEGTVYEDLASTTGGVIGNLCLQEFQPMFDEMATAVIGGSQLDCLYDIPTPPNNQTIDYTKVNVRFYETPQSSAQDFLKVQGGLGDCGAAEDAWYYDNETAPAQILLCPETCTLVQAAPEGEIEVTFGCATEIK